MGSGYRVFTAGEVLTASNVQNYLQDQAVMVFGGTAARSSAIGTANFEEGMLTYLTDVDKLQVYTGAAFADVYPAASSNQGLTLINTTSFSAVASISLPNNTFTSSFNAYYFVFNCTGSTAVNISARLRAAGVDNSSAVYNRANWESIPITSSRDNNQTSLLVGETYDSDMKRRIMGLHLFDPQVSGRYTSGITHSIADLTGDVYPIQRFHGVEVTTSYDSITFLTNTGTITGSISCYGYNQ